MDRSELIYDWNRVGTAETAPRPLELNDETLRDGLQSPSVIDPPIDKKLEILHLMDSLGIDAADIGLPGAGPRAVSDVTRLAKEIADCKLDIRLMLTATEEAVKFAASHGLPVMYVTEDTTRANPATVRALYRSAIVAGAKRICVCDTVGHATPDGVRALIKYIKAVIEEMGLTDDIKIDWHGHQDRGLGVINSIAAYEAGADRLHGTALGIGERVGNAPMDQLLVNLQLMGYIDRDLSNLTRYCDAVSSATGVPISISYPIVGRDAFRTATGVHAAAVIKAFNKGDDWLADMVYSGVPARMLNREQTIEIGPMSGKSNVIFWLGRNGIESSTERVERIFNRAKQSDTVLTDEEIRRLL